jgi:hypothetical protein
MDLKMSFKVADPKLPACQCIKSVRIVQVVGRFDNNNNKEGTNSERYKRTTPDGWRVDWPLGADPNVPFFDNAKVNNFGPVSTPWTRGGEAGTYHDQPGIQLSGHTFNAYTCFVGEKDTGEHVYLGCVKWGFKMIKEGRQANEANNRESRMPTYELVANTPEFNCAGPNRVYDAVALWNENNLPPHRLPIINEYYFD